MPSGLATLKVVGAPCTILHMSLYVLKSPNAGIILSRKLANCSSPSPERSANVPPSAKRVSYLNGAYKGSMPSVPMAKSGALVNSFAFKRMFVYLFIPIGLEIYGLNVIAEISPRSRASRYCAVIFSAFSAFPSESILKELFLIQNVE